MLRLLAISCLVIAAACASPPQDTEVVPDAVNFDACLMTNMAAVVMLEESIEETETFLTRAKMTEETYQSAQEDLVYRRSAVERLLEVRGDLLNDERLDESEQSARNSTLMRSYAGGADTMISEAKAKAETGLDLAVKATSCAANLDL